VARVDIVAWTLIDGTVRSRENLRMLRLRFDRLLLGTAMAVALAAAGAASAASTKNASTNKPVIADATVPAVPPAEADAGAEVPKPADNAAATEPDTTSATADAPAKVETSPPAIKTEATAPVKTEATEATAPAKTEATAPVKTHATAPAKTEATAPVKTEAAPAAQQAVTETAPNDPLASLDPADRPIAEKIRDLLGAKVDKIFATKREHAAAETFYQNRNLAPLWIEKGVISERGKAVIARLRAADTDGLDPADYKTPDFAALSGADALAEAELKLTETVLTYARHVQAGRFSYTSVSKNIELPQQPPETADVLTKVADAPDAGKALDEFSPPQPLYRALKRKLAELRARSGGGASEIASGPELKLTKAPMEDPRVPLLRDKLGLKGDPADLHYDSKLAEAVKKYQRGNDLKVTGNLDEQTIRELNGPPRDRQIDTIIVNMERWRWYPRDMGKTRVMVNLPDFTLRLFRNDGQIWMTRIVIGKPAMPTPLLTETMKYITVNPTWNVPQSIVQNEYLPALEQDPTVLERMGLKVVRDRDGVHIYQPPGDNNALGRLRFNFPNRFDVYQHDTPDKYLFAESRRAYSHGCMRVQDPVHYAELLLSIERPSEGYTEDRIRRMFGRDEQDIQFPNPVPVHLTYQTAFVDDDGSLVSRPDIYGLDSRVLASIKTERGMIDVASKEHDHQTAEAATAASRRPVRTAQPAYSPGPVSFFGALFGGGYQQQPLRPPYRVR
jgi:murein L,D-transpeptidase YcbB/YkuD